MHYKSWFPSKYICAEDLNGQTVPCVIERITVEAMQGNEAERRPVLYFRSRTKGLVLNRTNADRIAAMYGSDTDAWLGQEIYIYPSETDFRGETVPCVRVKKMDIQPSAMPTGPQIPQQPATQHAAPQRPPLQPASVQPTPHPARPMSAEPPRANSLEPNF
jgi:hypothetical protein